MSFLGSFFRSGPDCKALRGAGAPVIDVRSDDEWRDGHLEGAVHVPLAALPERIAEIERLLGGDRAKPLILVCRSGGRAEQARALLRQQGFTNVENAGAWTSLR